MCLSLQIELHDKVLFVKESFGCCSLEDLMKMEAVTNSCFSGKQKLTFYEE